MGMSVYAMLMFGFEIERNELQEKIFKYTKDEDIDIDESALPDYEHNNYPVVFNIHYTYDEPYYILTIPETKLEIPLGSLYEFSELPIIESEDIEKFKEWCDKYEIKYEEPRWILCSLLS